MPLTIRTPARVAVYAGSGASHSWTWFADLFEQSPAARTVFITEQDVAAGALAGYDVFFVSGGDTFAIAEGLGAPGAAQLERFVRDGGTYVGACAGAYLPLRSSLAPLSLFNFVTARIGNLARHAPAAMHMPEKCCTEYGCRYVVHPVRGEMLLRLHDRAAPDDPRNVTAPLYGGPAMQPSDDVEVLATYADFTAATEFLVDTAAARDMLIGAAAAVRKRLGAGSLYLFGPHFEHPAFPAANRLLMDVVRAAVRDRMPETMPRDGRIADAPPDAAPAGSG